MAEHIFPCPGCACKLEVLTEWRGKSVICPHCGKKFSLSPQYFTGVPESQFAPVSKDTSGTIPAYMQKSEVQHKRDLKRAKEKFIRGIIRFVTTAILFTGIAAALLFGGRWFFFTNSGFHKIASSGKVDLHTSGHGMYLKATTGLEKKAFTGKVSWKLNSIMWMALEFQNGEADGKQNLYMESGGEDILLSTFAFENGRLRSVLNSFIGSLPEQKRNVFVLRYFCSKSVNDIAYQMGFSEGKVKTILYRTRLELKTLLEEEGLPI